LGLAWGRLCLETHQEWLTPTTPLASKRPRRSLALPGWKTWWWLASCETKANWDEVIWEFTKMWDSFEYSHDGAAFSTPPRNVVPKPYGGGRTHPPMLVAAGNPPTYEKAARHGLGVLGFNLLGEGLRVTLDPRLRRRNF